MRAYQIGRQTGFDSLTLVNRPDPGPGPGEVVIAPKLAALNHRDMLALKGAYGPRRPEKRIPLSEGVGTVVSTGEGVTGWQPGQRVVFAHFVSWLDGAFSPSAFAHDIGITHDGWLAERLVIPAAALVAVPDSLSDRQAAPLASSALTAWHAIREFGGVRAGDTVLALGTGGVALATLQLAKGLGARVAITSSSDTKLELARELGADITINYRTAPDWAAEVMKETNGAGADIVVETGGLATLPQSIAAAAVGGRIVIIGALAGPAQASVPNYGAIIGKGLTLHGIAEGSRAMLERLVTAIAKHRIEPVIDRVFPFVQAADAYRHLEGAAHVGKVLIEID